MTLLQDKITLANTTALTCVSQMASLNSAIAAANKNLATVKSRAATLTASLNALKVQMADVVATPAPVPPATVRKWSSVPVGPGGFISGPAFHADGTKMLRMDTSGAQRWNAVTKRWDMMVTTMSMPAADTQPGYGANPGCYEIEIAKSNSSRAYMMWKGFVYITNDKGDHWIKTARPADTFDSNDALRGANKKLAVDPANPDVVICGGPIGVHLTANGGASWQPVNVPAAPNGHYLVAFDPSSATVNGRKQVIYCAVYGVGLFNSKNGGIDWTLCTGGPTTFMNLVVSSTGKVFVVRDQADPLGYTTNVFMLSGTTWTSISTGAQVILQGIAIDPTNPSHVVAVNSQGDLSVSTDAGLTWTGYGDHRITAPDVHWLESLYGGGRAYGLYPGATLMFDPSDPATLYLGEGLGIVKGPVPTSTATMQWTDCSVGLEQLCAKRLLKPPGGGIIAAVMDQGVFRADGISYPSSKGVMPLFAAGWDADYCPTDPKSIAVIVNQGGPPYNQSGISRDGGLTWKPFANNDFHTDYHAGGMIAFGTDPNNIVITTADYGNMSAGLFYTKDGGGSWLPCSIPGTTRTGNTGWLDNYYFNKHNLCADRVQPNTFRGYNYGSEGSAAGVYESTDGGANWTCVHAGAWPEGSFANARLVSVPGNAGHLFYCSGSSGNTDFGGPMRRSTDGGKTWAMCNTGEVIAVGFGKPAVVYPAIYIVGWVNKVYGIFQSNDNAVTWTQIGDFPLGCFDTPVDITGESDVTGNCYMSTSASGIFAFS